MQVGLIGTGMLGNAVGKHLLKTSFDLIVFNRTKSKTKELEDKGATVTNSPKEVAEKCDLIITVVKDAEAVRQVLFENDGIIYGKHDDLTVADMSTISPVETRKISERLAKEGISMLDIPVMGGPNVAIDGKLVMMASGNKQKFEKFKKVFDTIAEKNFFLGEISTAHSIKLVMNLQIAMLALALSEGITLARNAGVDPETFLKILNSTYFRTGMSENKAFKMIKDTYNPTFTLKNLKKDLNTINKTASFFGIKLPMSTLAEEVYTKAEDAGFGELDYTGILAYIKQATKSENMHN